ncbi:MAG: short-chain dehydrogenase [Flavobacteriaceae bacterium]|nr:short-chain dehydrogenase [Flavobacteriaceae bacterium]RCL67312.1 MAG: SDR family NAD(P)-dependent oxidoreductase [Cryomorphaceae bacterium]
MIISLKSKKALVGGSSKGLGNAVAYQLAMSGASVTLVSSNKDRLIKTVNDLRNKTGINHDYLVVDYNNFEDYKKIIKKYLDTNPIDILINNTQGPKGGNVMNVSIEDYQKSFDLLFKSVVFTTMLAIENMKKNKWGRIINMASMSVKEPLSYLALSNSIRSAVTTWGKTLSNDLGVYNITVNNILTGYFDTERINQLNLDKAKKLNIDVEEVYNTMKELVPLKRIGDPKEFSYLVTFLASDNAAYINGANIPIDGGLIKSL